MRILLCGGGTGGHVNPALSIAEQIKKQIPNAEIAFIGTKKGIESSLVPRAGYPISYIKVRNFKRKLTLSNIDSAVKAVTSVWAAKKILKRFRPDVVIGTGGYVSWPAVKAAAKLGIPTMIHEQNSYPGVTTKMLSRYADRVAISFEESRRFFSDKVQEKLFITGNPINIESINRDQARKKLGIPANQRYILSYGGSQGADRITNLVFEMMHRYTPENNLRHCHVIGKGSYQKFMDQAAERGLDKKAGIDLREYLYDMPLHLAAADLVISRAGAMTLSELAFRGKAAILIAYPYAAEDHQYKNALLLEKAGAAIAYRESDLDTEKFIKQVFSLLNDPSKLRNMQENIQKFSRPNAGKELAKAAIDLTRKK